MVAEALFAACCTLAGLSLILRMWQIHRTLSSELMSLEDRIILDPREQQAPGRSISLVSMQQVLRESSLSLAVMVNRSNAAMKLAASAASAFFVSGITSLLTYHLASGWLYDVGVALTLVLLLVALHLILLFGRVERGRSDGGEISVFVNHSASG